MSGTCRRCPQGESTVCQLLSLILLLALHEPKATSVYACTCSGVSSWVHRVLTVIKNCTHCGGNHVRMPILCSVARFSWPADAQLYHCFGIITSAREAVNGSPSPWSSTAEALSDNSAGDAACAARDSQKVSASHGTEPLACHESRLYNVCVT